MPNSRPPSPQVNIPAPDKKKKQESYPGYGNRRYGSENAAWNSWINAAESKEKQSNAAVSGYRNVLAQMGIKTGDKKTRAAIARFILGQADKAGANENPRYDEFRNLFIKKFYKTYLGSSEAAEKISNVKSELKSVFGDNWIKQIKANKEYAGLIKQYISQPQTPNATRLDQMIQNSKTWKKATSTGGEYQYYRDFTSRQASSPGSPLSSNIAAYKDYENFFNQTMRAYGNDPTGEEALFFKSGITKDDFAKNYSSYLGNQDAWKQVMGRDMSQNERDTAVYGITKGQAGLDSAKFGINKHTQFQEQSALNRASDVGNAISQYNPSLEWSSGKSLDQKQKSDLLYQEGGYKQTFDALKQAFSIHRSYSKSSGGGVQLSRDGNTIVAPGV